MSVEPHPPAGRSRRLAASGPVPALIVLAIPLLIVPLAAPFAGGQTEGERLPYWAVEAFGTEMLRRALAAVSLPVPILIAYGLVPLVVPPVTALIGLGTVGRWAALAGFCLLTAGLCGVVGLGLLLELVASGSLGLAMRLELLSALAWPLLAIESCGCLLASATARPDAR